MKKICETTQELVAMGAPFSVQEQEHLNSCDRCRQLFEEYQSLQLLVSASSEIDVPVGFADAVMQKIDEEETSLTSDWMQRGFALIERFLSLPQMQYLALSIGGIVSIVNLVRFVFFVLIPAQ